MCTHEIQLADAFGSPHQSRAETRLGIVPSRAARMPTIQPGELSSEYPVEVGREEDAILQRHVARVAEIQRRCVEIRSALGFRLGIDGSRRI